MAPDSRARRCWRSSRSLLGANSFDSFFVALQFLSVIHKMADADVSTSFVGCDALIDKLQKEKIAISPALLEQLATLGSLCTRLVVDCSTLRLQLGARVG